MMLNCLIIEDDPIYRQTVRGMVKKIPTLQLVAACSSAIEANVYLTSGDIDLIITDIEMADLSGLDFINALKNPPLVIFITSFPDYALKGFDVDAVDYLVKPVNFERFLQAVNKASARIDKTSGKQRHENTKIEDDHFFIRTDAQYLKLKYNEVIYIEAYGDFVKIYTKTMHFIALVNLKNIEKQLPSSIFIRVHRSHIVNIAKIESIDNSHIKSLHYTIPVSQAYKDKVYASVVDKRLVKRFTDGSEER